MALLLAGLVVFLASHSVGIVAPDWRTRQVARLGERPWKLAYSVVSLVALAMIVWGYGAARAEPTLVWMPPAWTRHVAALLTVIGFVLIAAAYVPGTRIKAAIGHPIVGDPVYSGPQWRGIPDKKVQKVIAAFPRQALHASRITLPVGVFEASLPSDMGELIGALR